MNLDKTKVILVGIESYDDDELHDLPAAFEGVASLSSFFTKEVGVPRENVKRLIDCSREDFLNKLKDFTKRNCENLIIYYAGHGILDDNREHYYLSFPETEVDDLSFSALSIEQLNKRLGSKKRNFVLILDSCFSAAAFSCFDQSSFFAMASSAPNKTSKYPLNQEHSAFTGELIKVMKEGLSTGTAFLSLEQIFEGTREALAKKGFPAPQKASRQDIGAEPFIKNNYTGDSLTVSTSKADEDFLEDIYTALVFYNDEICEERQKFARSDNPVGELKKLILKQFPYPIAYPLKDIYASSVDMTIEELRDVYKGIIEFLGVCILADTQYWDDKSDDLVTLLEEILNQPSHALYKQLIAYACTSEEDLFLEEIKEQYETIRKINESISTANLDIYELKKNLTTLVISLSFLSRYTLSSIRFIDVFNLPVNKWLKYQYESTILHGETESSYQSSGLVFKHKLLSSNSIILFKGKKLNERADEQSLWPLLVDINSFEKKNNTVNLHFFKGKDKNNEYSYSPVNKSNMDLIKYSSFYKAELPQKTKKYFMAFEDKTLK